MAAMGSIDDLLMILKAMKADELHIRVGIPPVIVHQGKQQHLNWTVITIEEAEQMLQRVANTRQRRELREHGSVRFLYTSQTTTPFMVQATLENETVRLVVS